MRRNIAVAGLVALLLLLSMIAGCGKLGIDLHTRLETQRWRGGIRLSGVTPHGERPQDHGK